MATISKAVAHSIQDGSAVPMSHLRGENGRDGAPYVAAGLGQIESASVARPSAVFIGQDARRQPGAAPPPAEPSQPRRQAEVLPLTLGSRLSDAEALQRWTRRLRNQLQSAYVESALALVAAVEAKDPGTGIHALNVAAYAEAIARRMQLPRGEIETLCGAALLHDIGKIGVPDRVLTKCSPLTDDERRLVRRHPQTALEILGHSRHLAGQKPVILHHHERFDGRGYPAGLAAERIPIGARILAVADALDTMLSLRTYKKPYSMDYVRRELQVHAGGQFDPDVAAMALRWLRDAAPFAGVEAAPDEGVPRAGGA